MIPLFQILLWRVTRLMCCIKASVAGMYSNTYSNICTAIRQIIRICSDWCSEDLMLDYKVVQQIAVTDHDILHQYQRCLNIADAIKNQFHEMTSKSSRLPSCQCHKMWKLLEQYCQLQNQNPTNLSNFL